MLAEAKEVEKMLKNPLLSRQNCLYTHPNAPWWKNPYTADAVEIDDSDQELQEAKPVDDAVDGPILMPRIFGP